MKTKLIDLKILVAAGPSSSFFGLISFINYVNLIINILAALQQISCAVFLKQVHDSPQASPPFPENAFSSLSWGAAFSVLGVILYAVVCILLFTDLVRICFAVPK